MKMRTKKGKDTPPKEHNTIPNIRLLSQDNELIQLISQSQANRLLNLGFAKLEFVFPLTVKAKFDKKDWKASFLNKKGNSKYIEGEVYSNVKMLHPNGTEMFHCSCKKALWYMSRSAVDIVTENPPTLKLKNIPKGEGHAGDAFYLSARKNICAVCGSKEELTRHHIVPFMYRKFFPESIKRSNNHDIVPLCVDCHQRYEKVADALKNQLRKEHNLTEYDCQAHEFLRDNAKVKKLADAIILFGDKIPADKKEYMYAVFREFAKKEEITNKDLLKFSKLPLYKEKEGYKELGQVVIECTPDLFEFSKRWRKHFLEIMNPAYMPDHWDVEKPIFRS